MQRLWQILRYLRFLRPRTLETKARALFIAAIIIIMSLALLWPWFRMESLADEQNLRVSREAARLELIRIHLTPKGAPIAGEPATRFRVEALGAGTRPPKWILGDVLTDPDAHDLTGFERRSIRHLRANPAETETNASGKAEGGGKEYRYLIMLRNTGECLSCHTAGQGPAAAKNYAVDENMAALSVTLPLPPDDWTLVANRAVIVLAGILGAVSAAVVFYWIAQKLFLVPVQQLQSVALRVSQGDASARSEIATGDEFQTFGETFNKMLENLDAGRKRLQDANASLDIKLGELAQVNVALHEANKVKSEFLANVSHELRTPLNSIIGFGELLRDVLPDDSRGRRYVNNILTSSRNLLELINDLLDLAKIEAGRMDVRLEMLSAGDLCETLANLVKPLADAKQLRLDLDINGPLQLIKTDPAKVRQIIYNLLSNAIKFTPSGGRVVLAARIADGPPAGAAVVAGEHQYVAFSVSDTGPGIAKEYQSVIFEKFRQLDGSVTREHQGTGLGLAISRELAGMLGGTIRVDSEPGFGATFTLTIPVDAAGVSPSVPLRAMLAAP